MAVVSVTRWFLDSSCWNNFRRPRNARTYELQLRVQRNLQRPRNAVNSSGLAVSRALYDVRLLLGWCCMEAAATGVCAGSLQWCLPCACRIFLLFFCMGFRQVLKLRLRGLSTWAGGRVIRTATNYDYRVHSKALDNSCGASGPVSEVLLRHHLRTARSS